MDCDGTKDGYDLEITAAVSEAVTIPVVASGGAGNPHHLAGLDADTSLGPLAVEANLASAQQLLQAAMAERREVTPEPTVEPQPLLVLSHRALVDFAHDSRLRNRCMAANNAAIDSTTDDKM